MTFAVKEWLQGVVAVEARQSRSATWPMHSGLHKQTTPLGIVALTERAVPMGLISGSGRGVARVSVALTRIKNMIGENMMIRGVIWS